MNPPHSLPPKKEVALALLERSSVFLHLDPRRERVAVPPWFKKQPQLVLQIGLNMPVPIHDLHLDDEKVTCTLSFNRSPFYCVLPWDSIYAMVGEDGRAMVWPDDIPPEVAAQAQARPAPAPAPALKLAEKPRDADKGDGKEKSERPDRTDKRDRIEKIETSSKSDKKGGRRPLEVARSGDAPKAKRASAAKKKREGGEATVTPIGGAAEPEPPRIGPKPQPAAKPEQAATPQPSAAPRPTPAQTPPRKPKRELPPYLRVIK
jgi:stringent starvation protein B